MPLPPNGTPWPPKELAHVTAHLQAWDAWYSGDIDRLSVVYAALNPLIAGALQQQINRVAQFRGGVQGVVARWFWGQPLPVGPQRTKLHIPIAADLCQAGADLVYAEPPKFTVVDEATHARMYELADDTLHGVLAESAEIGGALGGSYLRVTWDEAVVEDRPFLTCVHADAALPEFRWGRLVAVTFWRRIFAQGRVVWRHLERHELDASGNGIILHGLYQGGEDDLGIAVPLIDQQATRGLAEMVDEQSSISTESPGLAVVYIPHQRPQRRWRSDPVGSNLGRSVLDGVEHLMDALDEAWSSWMRDLRLAKARVFVASSLLDSLGPGNGAYWDGDQEIFSPLNALASRETSGLPLEMNQFAIRLAEHQGTVNALIETILRTAGFSSQTFGMDDGGVKASNVTATEVQARERRSYLTRDRMIRLQRPQVMTITRKLLAVDAAVFRSSVKPQLPNVEFADSVQESQITLAQTALALKQAQAASIETLVRLTHPDWDDEQVTKEAAAIKTQMPAAPAPVASLNGHGTGVPVPTP